MPNPFSKGWKYLMSSFDKSIEDNADPKVQIHQAAEAAREQHRQIQQQAATIIGNRNQLEIRMSKLGEQRDTLGANARAALKQAEKARADGDENRAQELESTAEGIATQLVTVEQELENTAEAHQRASRAAEDAQAQARRSEQEYQQLSETIRDLEAKADQAKMQETAAKAMDGINAPGHDPSVPTLDDVRHKIESRYANALGAQELAENSADDTMAQIESASTDMRASAKLSEIRAQLERDSAGELEAGEDDPK
ncbi:PspA/IM30 family protein [Corynebacterium sp. TAE3-ERU12]|uniref:PspA/IM30 family protein n=1 Tax=Corynebacterium sp. TAE3-ERU12 TaxID=2849491 RepID=UPI001C46EE4A|nr:PspA/IM30 family protein [Corynebacterium sp. TAE3-ERU12]MBV7294311.1 PspA/IM30 family protein [Corynebacterium sp. TAE3-ERU12]